MFNTFSAPTSNNQHPGKPEERVKVEISDTSRILVVATEPLLAAGLVSLLGQQQHINTIEVTFRGADEFMTDLKIYAPQVVIIDEELFMSTLPDLSTGLSTFPEVRIICLNLHNNDLTIYEKRRIQVRKKTDLMDWL